MIKRDIRRDHYPSKAEFHRDIGKTVSVAWVKGSAFHQPPKAFFLWLAEKFLKAVNHQKGKREKGLEIYQIKPRQQDNDQ